MEKLRAKYDNLERAKRLAEVGANTGFLLSSYLHKSRLIELAIRSKQAWSGVVASVTFGALSQGELTLALDTALPTK
jgi:hypothetical protein